MASWTVPKLSYIKDTNIETAKLGHMAQKYKMKEGQNL